MNIVNEIICGDSEIELDKIQDNSIDIVLTSPPYNFNIQYDSYNDSVEKNVYFNKLFSILEKSINKLKYGGRIIINIQPVFNKHTPTHHIISNFLLKKDLIWKGEIIWEKNNYKCKTSAFGSWKSPSCPYLKYTWEFIEVFCKGSIKKEGIKENIDITSEEFVKFVYAKWSIPPETKMKQYGHPAMFPEKLVEMLLKLFSYRGDIILDPFNGAGTTTYVANKLGRKYIGIDISQQYCEIAIKRLKGEIK